MSADTPAPDLSAVRRQYGTGPLALPSLSDAERAEPLRAVARWLDDALAAEAEVEPTAMVLATAEAGDRLPLPDARVVLCKGIDHGMLFFTSTRSVKASQLEQVPIAACVFHWPSLERQVRVRGAVERLTDAEDDAYFASRPRGSQVAAWASHQSAPVASRGDLEAAVAEQTELFAGRPVPRPPFWGGYRLVPTEIELWQGGADRLHDRLLAMRHETTWSWQRLQP